MFYLLNTFGYICIINKTITIMNVYFTADTHYHHKNICRGASNWTNKSSCRDFELLQDMDEAIIDGINRTVGADDVLFHLGDYAFGDAKYYREFRSRINCQNIYLIYGNHDERLIANEEGLQSLFTECGFYREVTFKSQKIILSHYGFRVWNKSHHESWMLHGHSHGTLKPSIPGPLVEELLNKKKYDVLRSLAKGTHGTHHANGKTMDVGIDTHPEFRPYSFDEIHEIMKHRKAVEVDDHKVK